MRRVILGSLFLLLATVTAGKSPWGAVSKVNLVDSATTDTAVDDPFIILKKLTSGMPVKVHFTIRDLRTNLGGEQSNPLPDRRGSIASQIRQAVSDNMAHRNEINAFYLRVLQKTADSWFKSATAMIYQQGKPKQFPEVLKHLSHQANFQVVAQEDQADLRVLVVKLETIPQMCNDDNAFACVVSNGDGESHKLIIPAFRTNMPNADFYQRMLLHEFGHVLGLGDQYEADPNPHMKYRSTSKGRDGVMDALGDDNTVTLDCDTVDGLINLIDIIYGMEPARKNGWPSLCKHSKDIYANGTVLGSGNYLFQSFLGEATAQIFTWQQDLGAAKLEKILPFVETDVLAVIPDQQVLQKDHLNRPLRTKGPAGEDIYYMYNYENSWRLITKNAQALRVEKFVTGYDEVSIVEWHFWAPKSQRKATFALYMIKGEGGTVTYYEQDLEDSYSHDKTVAFLLQYNINGRGQIFYHISSMGGKLPEAQVENIEALTFTWGEQQLQSLGLFVPSQLAKKSTPVKRPAAKEISHAQQAAQAKQAIKHSLKH